MPRPQRKDYNIYILQDHDAIQLWHPRDTLLAQRQRLDRKARQILLSYGSHAIVRWQGSDVLHLYGRSWVTSFYIA